MITEAQEITRFGCLLEDLRDAVDNSLAIKAGMGGPAMVVMSMLSDAQELLASGRTDQANQEINKAKWVLSTYLIERETRPGELFESPRASG